MWLFNSDGFFSAVQDDYCKSDELLIRARCKHDLCRLAVKLDDYCDESKILEIEHADYRYRMKVKKVAWSQYLVDYALNLDYSNVKDNIIPKEDFERKDAYYRVWEAMYRWQSLMKTERKK